MYAYGTDLNVIIYFYNRFSSMESIVKVKICDCSVAIRCFLKRLFFLLIGSEFLVPVRGYYCQLCEEFCGDAICAEDHATSQTHNEKYKVGHF